MTAGSPVRLVVLFSIPLIFGNIFQQLYYITDAVIVGKYISIQALAAVNSCTWITWLLNAIARDFSNTLSILASYSVGEGDQEKVKKLLEMQEPLHCFFLCSFLFLQKRIWICFSACLKCRQR